MEKHKKRRCVMGRYLWVVFSGLSLATVSSTSDAAVLDSPVTITPANRAEYTGILPTWRKVTPVGTVMSTPNFPTQLALGPDGVGVLANGATPFQTITWYDYDLQRKTRFAALNSAVPGKEVAIATPGGGVSPSTRGMLALPERSTLPIRALRPASRRPKHPSKPRPIQKKSRR